MIAMAIDRFEVARVVQHDSGVDVVVNLGDFLDLPNREACLKRVCSDNPVGSQLRP